MNSGFDQAKQQVVNLQAMRIETERDCQALAAEIEEFNGYLQQAQEKGEQQLAQDIQARLQDLQQQLEVQNTALQDLDQRIQSLKQGVHQAERDAPLAGLEQYVVQQQAADQAITEKLIQAGDSKPDFAGSQGAAVLARIKARRQSTQPKEEDPKDG